MQQIKVIKKYSLSTKGMITQARVGHTYHGSPSARTGRHPSTALCRVRAVELARTGSSYQSSSSRTEHRKECRAQEMPGEGTAENGVSCGTAGSALPGSRTVLQPCCQRGNCKHKPFTDTRALCLQSIIFSYNNCYRVLTLINFFCHTDSISSSTEIGLSVVAPTCSGSKGVHTPW